MMPPRSPWVWLPPAAMLALLAPLVPAGANLSVFLALNHAGHALSPRFWLHLTMFGDGAVALALVLPCIRRWPHCFWAALAAAMFAGLWTQVTKQVVDVPRPLAALAAESFYQAGPAYRHVSFPSGHAAAAVALAGIWIMGGAARPWQRLLALLLAILVGLSRIMVGVHWPLDVLWGMLGGWLGAWLGLRWHGRARWPTTGTAGTVAGLVLAGVAASLLAGTHAGMPAVLPAQRAVACVCLLCGAWEMLGMHVRLRRQRPARRAQVAAERTEKADG